MQLPYAVLAGKDAPTLLALLQKTALYLWETWPKEMQVSNFDNTGFALSGVCPHCGAKAAFLTVTGTFEERDSETQLPTRLIGAARCCACNKFILAILKALPRGHSGFQWVYDAHYPVDWPDDTVAAEIPADIKPDFQEALRCRWVKAYNATVEMCRRALEASCIEQGAASDLVLSKMIDWVHAQGKITKPLQQMAHKIKLGGNRAAHPSDKMLTAEDADAVIEFTREYFQHVYVMPARMAKFDFDKKKK